MKIKRSASEILSSAAMRGADLGGGVQPPLDIFDVQSLSANLVKVVQVPPGALVLVSAVVAVGMAVANVRGQNTLASSTLELVASTFGLLYN